eukprot:364170-Chlamydomonas_euryale.AAC.9
MPLLATYEQLLLLRPTAFKKAAPDKWVDLPHPERRSVDAMQVSLPAPATHAEAEVYSLHAHAARLHAHAHAHACACCGLYTSKYL